MRSKTLIIILVILVLLFIGVFVYFMFFRQAPEAPAPVPPTTLPPSGPAIGVPFGIVPTETGSLPEDFYTGIPRGQVQRVFALSTEPILGLALNPESDKVRYFLEANGNVVEVGFEGENPQKIVSTVLKGLKEVVWSNKRTRVAALLDNPTSNFTYDFDSGLSFDLASGVNTIDFSPDDTRVVFYQNNINLALSRFALSQVDGTGLEEIFRTGLSRWRAFWTDLNQLLVSQPPSGIIQSFILALNPDTGEVGKIIDGRYGLEFLPSPDGKKILISSTDSRGHTLKVEIYNLENRSLLPLVGGTIATKCTWASDNINVYCAVPANYSNKWMWPDDYYKGKFQTNDQIVKVNSETRASELLLTVSRFDVENLIVDPLENYLMFINRVDGIGYSIKD